MPAITPAQIRGARGMLDWSMVDLAKAAGVSVSTVKRVQDGVEAPSTTIGSIRNALEEAGIEFLTDQKGSGMRLVPRQASPFSRFL